MAERAVADVMKQPGHPQKLFDIGEGWKFRFKEIKQGRIELLRKSPCHMHRSEGMLEAGMLCGGKDPAGALELKDAAESLDIRRIDHIPFRLLPWDAVGHNHIVIDGIGNQSGSLTFDRSFLFCDPCLHYSSLEERGCFSFGLTNLTFSAATSL